jgi:hypothetical protein
LVRHECRAEKEQLTLRQSFELIRAAIRQPPQTFDESIHLAEHHLSRNAIASQNMDAKAQKNRRETDAVELTLGLPQ